MKISYNWLKEYIKTDLTAEQAAEKLTAAGLEVEALERIESIKGGLEGLVVAEVITCQKHPDADKLNVTTVSLGDGSDPLQVVCGAPNCKAGIKVVMATVGTTLYPMSMGGEALKIKRSKIRGVESLGMLCAEDEIGLGEGHDGIIILPESTVVGTPVRDVFEISDEYILEIGLTPNRVDASSHYGVARDLAAILQSQGVQIKASLPSVADFAIDNESLPIQVSVQDHNKTPRYAGITVSGVKIAPSPEWLQKCLKSIGLNPKNNVVDITNFILHECGQPLHAFDVAHIKGGQIEVRTCPEGTKFVTLDGVERTLNSEDQMICNAQEPMCMAGVFGGMDSGVSDTTTDIFIESAYFNPVVVRKAARRHGLSTDSSFRYERGIDPNMAIYALKRAALLIKELAGGHISSQIVDLYPEPIAPFCFDVDLRRVNALIGKQIPQESVITILKALEIEIRDQRGDLLSVAVPAYRVDVQRECDVTEEILRIYGFNNIENPPYIKNVITRGNIPTTDKLSRAIGELLSSLGATEIMNNSLTKSSYYQELTSYPLKERVKILNPLSQDLNVMRGTLLFGALESVANNSNRRNGDLQLFEIGNTYTYSPQAAAQENATPLKAYTQQQRLAITVTGLQTQGMWNSKAEASDIYTLKAMAEKIMERFGINSWECSTRPFGSDLYDSSVEYVVRGNVLFEMGVVSRSICRKMDIKAPVYYLELNMARLAKIVSTVKTSAKELSKFQAVKRDLALLVDNGVTFETLRDLAIKAEKKLLKEVGLFDVYQGDKLPDGKKSYALNFTIEDTTKTLTDKDIERIMANITRSLESGAGAVVRS